jgi:hypothetical protein
MSISRFLRKHLHGDTEATVLDFVPVSSTSDWRDEKVRQASAKLGRPFKCGPDHLPREVQIGTAEAFMILVKGTREEEPKAPAIDNEPDPDDYYGDQDYYAAKAEALAVRRG